MKCISGFLIIGGNSFLLAVATAGCLVRTGTLPSVGSTTCPAKRIAPEASSTMKYAKGWSTTKSTVGSTIIMGAHPGAAGMPVNAAATVPSSLTSMTALWKIDVQDDQRHAASVGLHHVRQVGAHAERQHKSRAFENLGDVALELKLELGKPEITDLDLARRQVVMHEAWPGGYLAEEGAQAVVRVW
jgi:hypothetical protein